MRRSFVFGSLLVAIGVSFGLMAVSSADQKVPAKPADEIAALRKRIELLEARIQRLELQRTVITTTIPGRPAPFLPHIRTVPPNWTEREINGMKYYIVPLESGQTKK